MSIPSKIRIGCFDYKVIQTSEPLIIGERAGYNGIADHEALEIRIKSTDAHQAKEQTFWHEVLHAIEVNYFLNLGDDTEKIIDSFARGIYSIMRDNPFLLPGQDHVLSSPFNDDK